VNYEGKTSDALVIKNDAMSDSRFYQFLYDAYISMFNAVKVGGAIYVCHADSEGINFRKAMKDAGWELKQCIIWVKNSMVMGRQDHHWQHEPILYGWKPGGKHKWYGGRKNTTVIKPTNGITINKTKDGFQLALTNGLEKLVVKIPSYEVLDLTDSSGTSIWNVDRPSRSGEHPTMKPLKLCAKAINNSSKDGDIVVDFFGGSGNGYGTGIGSEVQGYVVGTSTTGITVATTVATAGSSGINANLPPYYALAYIMKS
jgi:DNA modification methylase